MQRLTSKIVLELPPIGYQQALAHVLPHVVRHRHCSPHSVVGCGTAVSLAVERPTYHALLAALQALLADNDAGALMIAATPALIALLHQSEDFPEQIEVRTTASSNSV